MLSVINLFNKAIATNAFLWETGKITASKLKHFVDKVDLEEASVRGETTSYVKQIIHY